MCGESGVEDHASHAVAREKTCPLLRFGPQHGALDDAQIKKRDQESDEYSGDLAQQWADDDAD